ncbi:MAG: nifR3 family TIM-barrel protein [Myxococcota bacterium]|jgi:nifR3 family TIM-barrel protein
MEGITDRSFRHLIVECNAPGSVAMTTTEFVRVSQLPTPLVQLQEMLGDKPEHTKTGIQLMGNDVEILVESARRAAEAGADFIDYNFGCPAPRVFMHGAGSALLANPQLISDIVSESKAAVDIPVSAKIRSGIGDDNEIEDLCRRIEDAGADLIIIHGRLKTDRYTDPADWSRITRAVNAVNIPVHGNGDAVDNASINKMLSETGCAGVMIGRGALNNPWIFDEYANASPRRTPRQFAEWLGEYAKRMAAKGATPTQVLGKLKQAAKAMGPAGNIPFDQSLLRSHDFFSDLEHLLLEHSG